MKEKGPEVAHIELDGIHDKNVVPDKDYEDIQVLRQGNWLNVKPYVSKSETVSEFPISLIVENTSEREFFIRGKMPVKNGIRFEPEVIEERLAPSSSKEIIVKAIQSGEVISIAELNNNPIDFEMEAGFEREERDDISLKTSKILLTDWNHTLQKASNKITIDGNLDDWTESKMIKVNQPQYFNEDWDWKGKDDGRFEFGVNYDDKNVNIAVHFFDQKTIAKQDVLEERQDKFFVHLDTNFEDEEYKILEIGLGGMLNNSDLKNVKYQVSKTVNGQILELSIPLDQLAGDSKTQLQKIRVNVGIMDHDRPENTKPSVLWWRPVWGTNADYPGSGMFVRQ